MVSVFKFCLTRLYWKGLEKVFCGFYVLRLTQYFFNKTQISSVEAQKTLWGGAFWRKKFQFWRKYTINLLLRHKRGINSYSKMDGQVVMRCTASALRHLLCCQNLGGQLPTLPKYGFDLSGKGSSTLPLKQTKPTLPTRHWRPWKQVKEFHKNLLRGERRRWKNVKTLMKNIYLKHHKSISNTCSVVTPSNVLQNER